MLLLPTVKMDRFFAIVLLLLISHTVLVVAAAGVLHPGNTDDVMDIAARACTSCAQTCARIIRAAPQQHFVAIARTWPSSRLSQWDDLQKEN
ncbi:hypothetical protein SCLCIDRAFT_1207411 [Scleroderma citrinum Foug A]|uniref:Uncharacterized protein n=1 Tax=Scleroderma citrinum Foug A TaxID=1036808 RepID=A0A0C3EBQ0_9AGAM|nr:hypothetical protein SCLCIDRAFT_1207411 [Scleroderma citrinum Foug A]